MKKAVHITRDVEETVSQVKDQAKNWASPQVDAVRHWAEHTCPKVQGGLRKAAQVTADGVATVTPKIQEGLEKFGPKFSEAVDNAAPKLADTLEKTTPALQNAKDKVVEMYLPKFSDKLGETAQAVSKALDGAALDRAVENTSSFVNDAATPAINKAMDKASDAISPAVKHGRQAAKEARKTAGQAAKETTAQFKRQQRKATGGSARKGWLVFGMVSAAVAAAVALWRASRPVEDPWKTPEPVRELSEKAESVGSDLKDAAEETKETLKNKVDSFDNS